MESYKEEIADLLLCMGIQLLAFYMVTKTEKKVLKLFYSCLQKQSPGY